MDRAHPTADWAVRTKDETAQRSPKVEAERRASHVEVDPPHTPAKLKVGVKGTVLPTSRAVIPQIALSPPVKSAPSDLERLKAFSSELICSQLASYTPAETLGILSCCTLPARQYLLDHLEQPLKSAIDGALKRVPPDDQDIGSSGAESLFTSLSKGSIVVIGAKQQT